MQSYTGNLPNQLCQVCRWLHLVQTWCCLTMGSSGDFDSGLAGYPTVMMGVPYFRMWYAVRARIILPNRLSYCRASGNGAVFAYYYEVGYR